MSLLKSTQKNHTNKTTHLKRWCLCALPRPVSKSREASLRERVDCCVGLLFPAVFVSICVPHMHHRFLLSCFISPLFFSSSNVELDQSFILNPIKCKILESTILKHGNSNCQRGSTELSVEMKYQSAAKKSRPYSTHSFESDNNGKKESKHLPLDCKIRWSFSRPPINWSNHSFDLNSNSPSIAAAFDFKREIIRWEELPI